MCCADEMIISLFCLNAEKRKVRPQMSSDRLLEKWVDTQVLKHKPIFHF